MIGRAALRNPFIFNQIRGHRPEIFPKFRDMHLYIMRFVAMVERRIADERKQVGSAKKSLTFIGQCVDREGEFLRNAQRATGKGEFMRIIDAHIGLRGDEYWHGVPCCGVRARQNCE
jgi:tRNA-dihydrouridine synthase